ncbi:CLUMA_CG015432, isoform A [Clunio marinus]|uniref:CLUMA_CG015432, isoform A n=1 Tax=Clunio marinus TaxID=568069 RepID=A0A1J1IUT2_9DIPT|nr:CLUMA_CG015432, isoform A [Clunio marinus]
MNKRLATISGPTPETPISPSVPSATVDFDEPFEKEYSDEEDFELLIGFDVENAKHRLYNMNNSIILSINENQQRDMFLEVGVNVSFENPWKQIAKQFLEDHLTSDTYEMKILKEKLKEIEDDPLLLIGYVPHLSNESNDKFIIYLDELTCTEASEIIKRLEAVERRKVMKSIVKYPRAYQSMGSEQEVDLFVKKKRENIVDVELQSVYPMRYTNSNFGFRFADDVRDGYAELIPNKKIPIENIHRKMIDRSIQSGLLKITEEQQTDPTFPTNAWSQYLYEIDEEIEVIKDPVETIPDEQQDENDVPMILDRKKSKEEIPTVTNVGKVEEFKPSKQIAELLEILEFNQIDMYRNDYPSIAKTEIIKYKKPFIEEVCCFENISKCKGRNVISMDWHPEFSGVCVVAYGFNLTTKTIKDGEEVDVVKRTIIERNPILVWSFDDPLYPKLELEAIREISCISFCPYNGNIIVGGTLNGQIIIWDITGRLQKIEAEERETLTPEQIKNRSEIREFMNWSFLNDSNKIVLPAATSSIERSHENAITSIKWMATNYQCTSKGVLKQDLEHETQYRQFVTTSLDGNFCVWTLDWTIASDEAAKIVKVVRKINLPEELKEESSPFKSIDQMFHPHFKLAFSRPILSFTFNEGEFICSPLKKVTKNSDISNRIIYNIKAVKKEFFNPKMIVGTSVGEIILFSWEGSDFSNGAILNHQTMVKDLFAFIHDGPVTHATRNPFYSDVFISLGGFIFAIWHDGFKEFPIFWRRRESRLTGCQWSLDRPSVFFLISEDGTFEIWDLTNRIDIPSMEESLGGYMLTFVLQHKLMLSKRLLAIADYNTNLRIFTIPSAFVHQLPDEIQVFTQLINEEIERKKGQEQWKIEWYESNKDIVEARNVAEKELNDELEKKEKLRREYEEKRAEMAEIEAQKRAKKQAKKMVFDLPQRLEKKYNEQNYKRLLKVLMERKKVDKELLDKQTKVLKERMRYNEQKRVAIKENFSKINEDLSTIRARLIPVEEYQASRNELATEAVDEILRSKLDYQLIEEQSLAQLETLPEMHPMTKADILRRCKENRDWLNQSMGGGDRLSFENSKLKRHIRKMSDLSVISHFPGNRSVTFSADLKDHDSRLIDTPISN